MAYPSVTYQFSNGTLLNATQCNTNFTDLLSGITDGTKDFNVNSYSAAGSMCVAGDVYTKEYSSYYASSTVTGWTAAVSGHINYKKFGKLVTVDFYLTGTSNATTASFTLPYSCNAATIFSNLHIPVHAYDSKSDEVGHGKIASSNVFHVYNGPTSGTTFVNSGTKFIHGVLVYESA